MFSEIREHVVESWPHHVCEIGGLVTGPVKPMTYQIDIESNLSNRPPPQIDFYPISIALTRSQMIAHIDILTP